MSAKPPFLEELKRRNVIRAAILYIGAVWALAQGISQLGPSVGAPEWGRAGFSGRCSDRFSVLDRVRLVLRTHAGRFEARK